jgi:hypothetical protein
MAELKRDGDEEMGVSEMEKNGIRTFQFEAAGSFHNHTVNSFHTTRRAHSTGDRTTCEFLGSKCPGRMSRAVLSKILNLEFHWTRQ